MFKFKRGSNKSVWAQRRIDYEEFLKNEKIANKYTNRAYKRDYSFFKRAISIHFDSMGYVYDLIHGGDEDEFYDAFMRLGVKILHNSESIRHLINLGLYGSGWTIYRTLSFDVLMLWYLYFNPNLIKEWSKEKFNTYKDVDWRKKFSEKTIIDELNRRGKKYLFNFDYETDFRLYSKAAHPSYFGVRFFQNENGELSYLPSFSMKAGHLLLGRLIGVLPYSTQILLEKNKLEIEKNQVLGVMLEKYNKLMHELNDYGKCLVKFNKERLGAKNARDIVGT
ncbi:MAG: hypothetical protein Q8Q08_06710 [Candidatus Omnitrophota bacterium]|nr:hypothetical protein [Candidatus Omnitrophota bacterium]